MVLMMSNEDAKVKHSKRIHQKKTTIENKIKLAKAYNWTDVMKQPHRYLKCSLFSCGNKNCVFCANPRKIWKEDTIQEKRQKQKVNDD
jgi:hypothetical protein